MKSNVFKLGCFGLGLAVMAFAGGCTPAESNKAATQLTPDNVAGTTEVSAPVPETPATVNEARGQGTMEPRAGLAAPDAGGGQ